MNVQFDAGKALGFVFDVIKARPRDFVILAVWTILYGAAFSVFQIYGVSDEAQTLSQVSAMGGTGDPSVTAQAIGDYFGAYLPYMAVAMLLGVVLEAAWLRLFVRGEYGGLFPFRVGRDEFVYALTGLAILLVLAGAVVVATIAAILLIAVLALLGPAGGFIGGALSLLVVGGITTAALILVMPALALSLLKGRFSLGQAMKGVRRAFWPLAGAAVTVFVGFFVLLLVSTGAVAIMPFDEYGQLPTGEMASVPSLFLYYAMIQTVLILPVAMMRGVASYAALRIDEGDRPLSDTFE